LILPQFDLHTLLILTLQIDTMDLFLKLLFGSFVITCKFEMRNNRIRINILFSMENRIVYLDELSIFEIHSILPTFLGEQLEYEVMAEVDEFEKNILENIRKEKLNQFYKEKSKILKKLGIN
jgi:hypothetical protein